MPHHRVRPECGRSRNCTPTHTRPRPHHPGRVRPDHRPSWSLSDTRDPQTPAQSPQPPLRRKHGVATRGASTCATSLSPSRRYVASTGTRHTEPVEPPVTPIRSNSTPASTPKDSPANRSAISASSTYPSCSSRTPPPAPRPRPSANPSTGPPCRYPPRPTTRCNARPPSPPSPSRPTGDAAMATPAGPTPLPPARPLPRGTPPRHDLGNRRRRNHPSAIPGAQAVRTTLAPVRPPNHHARKGKGRHQRVREPAPPFQRARCATAFPVPGPAIITCPPVIASCTTGAATTCPQTSTSITRSIDRPVSAANSPAAAGASIRVTARSPKASGADVTTGSTPPPRPSPPWPTGTTARRHPPPPSIRSGTGQGPASIDHHRPDRLARMHQVEPPVDVLELQLMRDHRGRSRSCRPCTSRRSWAHHVRPRAPPNACPSTPAR